MRMSWMAPTLATWLGSVLFIGVMVSAAAKTEPSDATEMAKAPVEASQEYDCG